MQLVDPEDAEEQKDSENWEFVNLGPNQSFGIATAGLEEKATACQMLVCYAKELGGQFEQYIEDVTKLMVPLLKARFLSFYSSYKRDTYKTWRALDI